MFRNKYRIESSRLQTWDYTNEGMYFVTIFTTNKEHFWGEITTSPSTPVETQCIACLELEMYLSDIGKVAALEWHNTQELRLDMNISLDAFIVMPNHIHGIIAIGANEYNSGRDVMHRISTGKQNNFGPQSKNLASILRGYKSAVITFARKNNILFGWQPRFHDHIIRSQEEYEKIADIFITTLLIGIQINFTIIRRDAMYRVSDAFNSFYHFANAMHCLSTEIKIKFLS